MKKCFAILITFFLGQSVLASNSLSTVNSFAPGSSQINFTSVESARTLDYKKFSFLGFLDSSYQSLAIYNANQTGNDVLSFTHIGLSYGFSPKLEIGIKGPAVFNQTSDSSQASLVLTAQGFVNIDGFVKYRLFDSVKSGLSLMAQLGVANGDEIFYVGPGSGLNYSLSALYERSFGRWLLAANLGYIQRNPGQQESLPFFEPIQSTIVGSVGLGRPITQRTKISGELLVASHDYVEDNSDREALSAEALVSFHTKMKSFNLSYGVGAGLTNGIATPTVRGFLGFQYPFGPGGNAIAKKEEVIEDEEKVIEEPEMIVENEIQPEILTDDEDDAFADLTEQNMEEVFEEGGKPAQMAQELPTREVVVSETVFTEPEVRVPAQTQMSQKFILDHVEFDFDSAVLDKASLKILNKVLEEIKKVEFKSIKIWGHTDFFGPSVYNEYLGLKRAKAVYDFFKKAGIPDPFIDYDAFGERRPVSVGIKDKARRKNRRVEVIVFRDEE